MWLKLHAVIYIIHNQDQFLKSMGSVSTQSQNIAGMGVPIIKLQRPHDCLILKMEIHRQSLYWNRFHVNLPLPMSSVDDYKPYRLCNLTDTFVWLILLLNCMLTTF